MKPRGFLCVLLPAIVLADSGELAQLQAVLAGDDLRAQQQALRAIAEIASAEADRVLLAQFDRHAAGDLAPGLWLDLFEAAAKRDDPALKARLAEHERTVAASRDPLRQWRECLDGGDAAAGRAIFATKPEAGCIRCHKVGEEGGAIGPDLTGLGLRMDRVFILESIVDPSSVITPGFPHVLLKLNSGENVSGVVAHETPEELRVTSITDGKQRRVLQSEIAERTPLPSAMPPGLGLVLGKRAVRDLVEFIATSQ